MKKQSSVGVWVMGFGKLLLVTVLVVCVVDIADLSPVAVYSIPCPATSPQL